MNQQEHRHAATDESFTAELREIAASLGRDPLAAAQEARDAAGLAPGQPEAVMLLAAARRLAGDVAGARDLLAAMAEAQPRLAAVQYELGLLLRDLGEHQNAAAALARAVELEPADANAWRALAECLSSAGRVTEAARAYAKHFQLRIADFARMEAAGADSSRLPAAEEMARSYVKAHATDATAYWMLAGILLRLNRYEEAESLLRQALELAPQFSAARQMLAGILFRYARYGDALALLEPLLKREPENTDCLRLQAKALLMLGETERAIGACECLLAKEPELATVWADYAHALKSVGRADEAVQAFLRAIRLRPQTGEAWWGLASLRTFRFTPDDIETMRQQLAGAALDPENRIRIHHALGKALEDEKRYAESFREYAQGNALRRKAQPYNEPSEEEGIRRIKAVFTRELFAARKGEASAAHDPIFIVGMTRAGSTLVEQILASHSMVEGTQELQIVTSLVDRLNRRDAQRPYPEILPALPAEEFRRLGDAYLDKAQAHRRQGRPFFTDKTPGNFLHAGFIHLMLPNAKIIDARRHPLACGFANFRQYYPFSQTFASDLSGIGHFYRGYVELMAHFDSVLPGTIHRVFYEELVSEPEAVIRRLLNYCGLPFEESCLRFHETKRAVMTPSSEQVRQPLYTHGMEQWRNYEAWLGPLKTALGDVLERYPAVPDFSAMQPTPAISWGTAGGYRWINAAPQGRPDKP